MGNIFTEIANASTSLSLGAYKVATIANSLAAMGVVGSVAQTLGFNQPLLKTIFGDAKGAALSLIAIAISHAATTIAAYGAPAGGVTAANVSTPTVVQVQTAPTVPIVPASVVEETLSTKTTTQAPPATS